MTAKTKLNPFFYPDSVAVIQTSTMGSSILAHVIDSGFEGKVYSVGHQTNPTEGVTFIDEINALPLGIELAILCVPSEELSDVLALVAARHVKSVILLKGDFHGSGKAGLYLERDVASFCEQNGITFLGPNSLGAINTINGFNASLTSDFSESGSIAFFSQSGALCVAIWDWALGKKIGFSKFVSLGNPTGLHEADMLSYLSEDAETRVILGYVEHIADGDAFIKAARIASTKKPVIMIKSGATSAGVKAVSSHTGVLAGSDRTHDEVFRQAGVIRAHDVASMFELAQAFTMQPLPKGPNLAVVTNSGSAGILAADATEHSSLTMATLSQDSMHQLQNFLPNHAGFYNPVDILEESDAACYQRTLTSIADDPMVHSILVILTPTASVVVEDVVEDIIRVAHQCGKTVFACFMGRTRSAKVQARLSEAGIPCHAFPESAVHCLDAMYRYVLFQNRPPSQYIEIERDLEAASQVIQKHIDDRKPEIVEFEAHTILNAYGIATPMTLLARSSEEVVIAAEEIGFPVVLKIASPHIVHKSNMDCVKVNLADAQEVREAFTEMTSRAQRTERDAYIAGCLVQQMAPPSSKEVIIGFKRDEQFGPMLMFGLGDIYGEIFNDISFKLSPLTRRDASEIVREIKSFMLLRGFRGERPIKLEALEGIVLALSQLALDFPQICDAELSPVLVDHQQALVANCRMTLQLEDPQ